MVRRFLPAILLLAVSVGALSVGLDLRRWAWEQTRPIRFGDIFRGYKYGLRAATEGYLDLYDLVIEETPGPETPDVLRPGFYRRERYREFDYAPLRLLTMMLWVRQIDPSFPPTTVWRPEYEFTAPALRFNILMEITAAVGIFMLTRHWVRRGDKAGHASADPPGPWRGCVLGMIAALLFWFNPAVILSAHGWPTWDMWIIPFFIWALYLACLDWWFVAGMVLGIGALFKGQQLIVAPFFVLWPVFMGRFDAALRWVIGLALAVALVVSVWMVRTPLDPVMLAKVERVQTRLRDGGGVMRPMSPEQLAQMPVLRPDDQPVFSRPMLTWVLGVAGAMTVVAVGRGCLRRRWVWAIPVFLLTAGTIYWAWQQALPVRGDDSLALWLARGSPWKGGVLAVAMAGTALLLPRRWQGWWWAACVAGALWMCIPLGNASTGWMEIGWKYGTHHWEYLIMGLTDNIPGLMAKRFGWDNNDGLRTVMFTIPSGQFWLWPGADYDVTLKTLLAWIYFATLVLCAYGAARHYRYNDRRFLVAAIAPWVMMFTILGQMHERYLLFAAGAGMCLVAVNLGFTLLALFMSAVTWIMTIHVMLMGGDRWFRSNRAEPQLLITRDILRQWRNWADNTHPDLAWGVALCACIFLYVALTPPRGAYGMGRRLIDAGRWLWRKTAGRAC